MHYHRVHILLIVIYTYYKSQKFYLGMFRRFFHNHARMASPIWWFWHIRPYLLGRHTGYFLFHENVLFLLDSSKTCIMQHIATCNEYIINIITAKLCYVFTIKPLNLFWVKLVVKHRELFINKIISKGYSGIRLYGISYNDNFLLSS